MSGSQRPRDMTTVVQPDSIRRRAPALSLRVVVEGALERHALPERGELVVGRGDGVDVRIEHAKVSRRHAAITVSDGRVTIEDLESANGTRVGEMALQPGEPVTLVPGEVVDIGPAMLVLERGFAGSRARRILPHGYFEARVEEECERAARGGTGFALVRARAGDGGESLVAAAAGPTEVIGRYGPGEYEVLVPAGGGDAAAAARRLEAALGEGGVATGTALYPRDGRSGDALIAAACRALEGGGAAAAPDAAGDASIVVACPATERVHRLARRVAGGSISVLVLGETGAGKEVIAELIHRASPRAAAPLLRLNCGGFSETLLESELFGHERGAFTGADRAKPGLLESADGGTVFLDEIGELPPALQVKLLRVLEDRKVQRVGALRPTQIDVRFVAATNRDLEEAIAAGRFREDLYYRINGITIEVPPLRERVPEIAPLARLFVARAAGAAGVPAPTLTAEAVAMLESYAWPGNIRELRNVMERAVLLAGAEVGPEHLPEDKIARVGFAAAAEPPPAEPPPAEGETLRDDVDELERRRVLEALEEHAGNQTRAARALGISRGTLAARMDKFGIPRPRKK